MEEHPSLKITIAEARRLALAAADRKREEEMIKPEIPVDAPKISEVIGILNAILEQEGDLPVLLSNSFRERWEVPEFELTLDKSAVYIE